MLNKLFRWFKSRFVNNKKQKAAFDRDNPFLIL